MGELSGKDGISLALFSGNVESRVVYLDTKYDYRKHFQREVWSYDRHMMKPDREFVDVLVAELGCAPESIAYLDDAPSALAPAEEMGIKGILYETGNIQPVFARLRELGVPLSEDV
eukprot:NODE_3657_length_386_cov_415.925816_g3093_i0.p1 GENE.NODE_3657_length_386_cov_415.925816_g3093_i0~~NODE_3657_length_386_cov_415.925816_g3093_i0.p1  ORF type:complete len:116 (-),score=14.05 NODE_3657_length_386_cov_415.925816_g3093_i0:7-354(-)